MRGAFSGTFDIKGDSPGISFNINPPGDAQLAEMKSTMCSRSRAESPSALPAGLRGRRVLGPLAGFIIMGLFIAGPETEQI